MSRASLGVNPVTGTLAATEGADTAAFIGLAAVFGTLAAAEGADRGGEHLPSQPKRRRQRQPRPSDGLLTAAQAASKLGCSIKTLKGHIAAGRLKYLPVGHGTKRQLRMFTNTDLDEFIANQSRKDVPCPSTSTNARRTINTTSSSEVIAFTALRRPRPGVKPKK